MLQVIGILILLLAGAAIFFFLQHLVIQDLQIENKLLRDQLDRRDNPANVIFDWNSIHQEFLDTFKEEMKG